MDNPLDDLVDEAGERPDMIWKAAGAGAGILGALVARKVLARFRGNNPESRSWVSAVVWTSAVGLAATIGRLGAQRAVAAAWVRRNRSRSTAT